MELFDVCVIGNDLSAYWAVTTLQKKGHKVAHVKAFNHYLEEHFSPTRGFPEMNHEEGLIGTEGITHEILSFLGMDQAIKHHPATPYKEILSDGRVLSRAYDKESFRIYLLRHFPQHAEAIDCWMADITKKYHLYAKSLKPTEAADTSMTYEYFGRWADISLDAWLSEYFQNASLKESVQCFTDLYPQPLSEIRAIDYLMYYFTAFEENGQATRLSFSDWVKWVKKNIAAQYYASALIDVQFNGTDYTVELKNKTQFKARFLMGQTARMDAENTTYRWIDVAVEPTFYRENFKLPIHFRGTPLFEHLKIIPIHTIHPKKHGSIRIEVVSQADQELIMTYIDRHFKGFEAAKGTVIERQSFRKNKPHLYESYAMLDHLELRDDLWDEPKWIQVPLNASLKKPFLMRLLKGVYFGLEMDRFIKEESTPQRSSVFVQAAENLMLKMRAKKPRFIQLQAGYQSVFMHVNQNGAVRTNRAETTIKINLQSLMESDLKVIEKTDIEADEPLKTWFLKSIYYKVKTDPRKMPLWGMIANAFVLMLLWGLRTDPFATFGFGAWLIFKETIYLMRYRTFTSFESILGIAFIGLGFMQVIWPFNAGFIWIVLGLVLMVINEHRSGLLNQEFSFDPVHQSLSKLYLNTFQLRMSHAISLSFVLMGLSYGMNQILAPVAMFIVSAGFILWTYFQDKRDYIPYHTEESV